MDNKKPPVSGRTQGAYRKTVTKNDTIMSELAERPLNRFEAEKIGDTVCHQLFPVLQSFMAQSFLEVQ